MQCTRKTIPRPGLSRPSWANLTTDQWAALTANQWAEMEVAPTFHATYDAWNRLVKLTDGGNGETVQENQYDGRGYRIVTKTYTDGTLAETRHAYFTDQWRCIEERLGTSSTPDRQFVWGIRYIDDLILRDRSVAGGTLNERFYSMQDATWNVTSIVDSGGSVLERYEYDPFGVATVLSSTYSYRANSDYSWEIRFTGQRFDIRCFQYQFRRRYYDAKIGTFLSRDPEEYSDGASLYCAYFVPNGVDPFGDINILPTIYSQISKAASEAGKNAGGKALAIRNVRQQHSTDGCCNGMLTYKGATSAAAVGFDYGAYSRGKTRAIKEMTDNNYTKIDFKTVMYMRYTIECGKCAGCQGNILLRFYLYETITATDPKGAPVTETKRVWTNLASHKTGAFAGGVNCCKKGCNVKPLP